MPLDNYHKINFICHHLYKATFGPIKFHLLHFRFFTHMLLELLNDMFFNFFIKVNSKIILTYFLKNNLANIWLILR
jgi:hypothetical protein